MYRKQFRLRYVGTKCVLRVCSSLFIVDVLGICRVYTADSSMYR
jgi:hypothetical protein